MTGLVNVGVTATRHVFHESNVAGSKHVPGAITGANLDFAGEMNDQPAFGKRVEVPAFWSRQTVAPGPRVYGSMRQFRVSSKRSSSDGFHRCCPQNSIDSHRAPPHRIARCLSSGRSLVRQTIESAQNSLDVHCVSPAPVTHRKHTD